MAAKTIQHTYVTDLMSNKKERVMKFCIRLENSSKYLQLDKEIDQVKLKSLIFVDNVLIPFNLIGTTVAGEITLIKTTCFDPQW